jgi:hypothetical protein
MAQALPVPGVLRVVSNAALDAQQKAQDAARQALTLSQPVMSSIASHITTQFDMMKRHRSSQAGWNERMLAAMRAFNGQYEASKLAEIRQFGGSEVYARIISAKCRGATALLRDVYLSSDRPWALEPPADPDVPPEIMDGIKRLVMAEVATLQANGVQFDVNATRDRVSHLIEQARSAARKQETKRAKLAEDKVEELLQEGGFYHALAEFLVDLPQFPFACIKGPTVKVVPTVTWEGNRATLVQKPRLFWHRVSPFDIWWTPGAADVENAAVIERTRVTRADLNDLLDLPGYNQAEVRAVLDEYGRGGIADNWDTTDSERAVMESRENPVFNQSGLITCLEFHGNVQGRVLHEYGMDKKLVPDELRDYTVQAWMIGTHVIKVQLSPNPRRRHNYYITSFEKVPGTPVGNALPDILSDIENVCNATLRSLVNNLSISSGPQVVINMDRLSPDGDPNSLYPWKRWHMTSDPVASANTQVPVSFFQPVSNANELLSVYKAFSDIADELSAIPKYLSGGGAGGGAGRTASGLAMLMGNSSKLLQTVAANVDRDIFEPCLGNLYDMVMLTDTSGLLTGEENVRVRGVSVAVQRETQRARQLEFLQITANPIDTQITGVEGRAAVLRAVSDGLGLPGDQVVPDEETLKERQQQQMLAAQQQQQQQLAQDGARAQGTQKSSDVTQDMGPRTRIAGGVG